MAVELDNNTGFTGSEIPSAETMESSGVGEASTASSLSNEGVESSVETALEMPESSVLDAANDMPHRARVANNRLKFMWGVHRGAGKKLQNRGGGWN